MSIQEYQVLLVSDNNLDARSLEQSLENERRIRLVATRARDLDEALKVLGTRQIDAILLDFSLPDGDGIRNCLRIREADNALPVIVVLDQNQSSQAPDALAAGAQDILTKTECDSDRLSRTIRYAIERSAVQSKLAASEALLQSILQNVNEGVIVADRSESLLLLVNPAARDMLGIGSIAGLPTDIFGMYEPDTVTRNPGSRDGRWPGRSGVR